MKAQWDYRYAQRTQRMKASAIRELLKVTENPEIISFAGGLPAPDVFPAERISEASERVMKDHAAQALQYGATNGYKPLRELIVEHSKYLGLNLTPANVLITSGSQQALDLIGKVFINEGDHVLVESPTYLGALQAWNQYRSEYVTVRTDNDGMVTDEMEDALRTGPKFMYVLPNFQNPMGVTLSLPRRQALVKLADEYGVPIIEDDPYGQLRYEGKHVEAVVSLESKLHEQSSEFIGNTIYLSTFSKILAPGLRLGWVIAPEEVVFKLETAKQGTDLHTSTFNQILAYEVAKGNFIDEHVKLIRKVYSERRDVMLNALEKFMPEGISWTRPEGGLFLWVTLPEKCDTTAMFPIALKQKVAYVPGESMHPRGGGKNTMRLNFSYCKPDVIVDGIARLAETFKQALKDCGS